MEVQKLRVQQDIRDSAPAPISPVTGNLIREIVLLRALAEMDEMREVSQGPLPSYSPPPQPIPGISAPRYPQ